MTTTTHPANDHPAGRARPEHPLSSEPQSQGRHMPNTPERLTCDQIEAVARDHGWITRRHDEGVGVTATYPGRYSMIVVFNEDGSFRSADIRCFLRGRSSVPEALEEGAVISLRIHAPAAPWPR